MAVHVFHNLHVTDHYLINGILRSDKKETKLSIPIKISSFSQSASKSTVGGRKEEQSIRNHIPILNRSINYIVHNKKQSGVDTLDKL